MPKKVLVIDDSALIRQLLTDIISRDPELEVVGAAAHPLQAREMIKKLNPDVLTLDIEMPQMDGISFLEKVMRLRPMPVVMISSLTERGAEITLQALSLGAVDFIAKPKIDIRQGLDQLAADITGKVKAAAGATLRARTAPVNQGPIRQLSSFQGTELVIGIGASTGGVEALLAVMSRMPKTSPGIVITQHMPPKFTTSFADRLDRHSELKVCEAAHGQRVLPGHAYLAPGDYHMRIVRSGANYNIDLQQDALISGHRPSVDALFSSLATSVGKNAIGAILTGMGHDGAEGLLALRQAGGRTLGQSASSCVVYGMPKAAYEAGGVEKEVHLDQIADEILNICGASSSRAIRV